MEAPKTRIFWKTEPWLGGLALLLLLMGCFFVLRPFVSALMWATILAYSLYPLQRVFTRWFRGSRTLAACLVTITMTLVLVGPVVLIGMSIAQDGKDLAVATRNWFKAMPAQPPPWVGQVPVFGNELGEYWTGFSKYVQSGMAQLDKEVKAPPQQQKIVVERVGGGLVVQMDQPDKDKTPPQQKIVVERVGEGLVVQEPLPVPNEAVNPETVTQEKKEDSSREVTVLARLVTLARGWLISAGLAVGQGVTEVLISVFLAFFLLRDAPELAERLAVAVGRLAGDRGRHLIRVAGDTVRGVIFGILGTAIVQALVSGLGFWIAGVPGVVLLAVLTFFLAVMPFGPPLIWLPVSFWLFAQNKPGMGIFMLLYGLLGISSVDNFLRPYLISQGNKMPFVLIFCGVIGGAMAFGLVGVFIGPTLLAVAFRLIEEWSSNNQGMVIDPQPDEFLVATVTTETPDKVPDEGEFLGA